MEDKWIKASERMPDSKGEYLVAYFMRYGDKVFKDEVYVGVDSFRGRAAWAKNKTQEVLYWMPLPKPPAIDKADVE